MLLAVGASEAPYGKETWFLPGYSNSEFAEMVTSAVKRKSKNGAMCHQNARFMLHTSQIASDVYCNIAASRDLNMPALLGLWE